MDSCKGAVSNTQQTHTEGLSAPSTTPSRNFDLKQLINKINYIHFLDGTITACFRHKRYDTTLSALITPEPCTDQKLICHWGEDTDLQRKLQAHQFQYLLVNDGQKALLVEPTAFEIDENGLVFSLPETCKELNSRKLQRHYSNGITAQLIQNGSCFQGELIEFSATTLQIMVKSVPPQTFQWLNPETPAALVLSRESETIYSTECTILKQSCGQNMRHIMLSPTNDRISKFKPKKHRSTRQRLTPAPNIHFRHPLTGKWIDLDVADLSGSGLAVKENLCDSVLLPGLIIPELTLTFANSDSLKCKAQVIYRIPSNNPEQQDIVKCGIAFLDMKIDEQSRLLALLYQAGDKRLYLSNRVDLDSLWKFFFDSGFIYPEKYLHLKESKESFKKTYQLLYEKKPNIAKHFIYQDNGAILAHISMIRFYRNSWLIHHHASRKASTQKGGIAVLSQISRYANEAHRLYSAHLNFVFCYFRPNNRFPQRVFGGIAKHINNPQGCSVDSFSYFHFKKSFNHKWNTTKPWSLTRSDSEDLQELKRFIDHSSGGLMVPALDLDSENHNESQLFKEYHMLNMKREQHLFSLKIKDSLKAVVILNTSEIFLNMSDLTNCFKVIIIDPNELTKEILLLMLSILCEKFGLDEAPALMYPSTFSEKINISSEKTYNLWILNLQYLDDYFDFCTKMIRNFNNIASASQVQANAK